jgi:predicted AlkP superfamily pyrophosphatase or phosphodiesterase
MHRRHGSHLVLAGFALPSLAVACAAPKFELNRNALGFELPKTPMIVFCIDGLNKATFEDMAQKSELPLLKHYLLDRGVAVDNAIACVPSVTHANATSMVTGQYTGHHGIFANRWFDQNLLTTRNYETKFTMGEVNHDFSVPTIYEILADKVTCVIGMQVNRGAHIPLVTSASKGGLPAGIAFKLGENKHFDWIITGTLGEVATLSRMIGHWPDFMLLYLPTVDAIGHSMGPQSGAYRSALRDVDLAIGSALRTLDDAGLLDRMTVVLTADHGHHQVGAEASLELNHLLPEQHGIPTYLTNTAGEHEARLSYSERFVRFQRSRIVATHAGERCASLHLRSKEGWSNRPTLDELLAFHREGTGGSDPFAAAKTFPEVLVQERAIDFAAVRVIG